MSSKWVQMLCTVVHMTRADTARLPFGQVNSSSWPLPVKLPATRVLTTCPVQCPHSLVTQMHPSTPPSTLAVFSKVLKKVKIMLPLKTAHLIIKCRRCPFCHRALFSQLFTKWNHNPTTAVSPLTGWPRKCCATIKMAVSHGVQMLMYSISSLCSGTCHSYLYLCTYQFPLSPNFFLWLYGNTHHKNCVWSWRVSCEGSSTIAD